jgi:NAD(P)-dependent dehydrogenase (short-subunit alcohol dehydrogenase family)
MKSIRVAMLTGATTGIGKATAQTLAIKGVSVMVSGRRKEVGRRAVDDIRARGGEASFVFADVDEEASVRQLIQSTVEKYGRLDMAVNNAGVSNETSKIHQPYASA